MTRDRDALAEVGAVVRRSLAARTNDQDLIDDLTQEALLRLTATDRELSADEQRAYAVVTREICWRLISAVGQCRTATFTA